MLEPMIASFPIGSSLLRAASCDLLIYDKIKVWELIYNAGTIDGEIYTCCVLRLPPYQLKHMPSRLLPFWTDNIY